MCDMTRELWVGEKYQEWMTCVCGDEDNDNDYDQKVHKNMIIWKVQSCSLDSSWMWRRLERQFNEF